LKSSVAQSYNATYTAALTACSESTYDELLAVVGNVENFNLPETGKYYLVKNNYNGKYMRVTASGTRGTVFADLTAAEAEKDASAHFCFTEHESKLYMTTQGQYLNWVYGRTNGYEGYTADNFDKYVHFAAPAPGVGAFSIAYGNGVDDYAEYLGIGFYALKSTETNVVAGSPTDQTHEMAQWTFEEVTTMDVALNAIGSSYYATLCVPFAYTVSGANVYTLTNAGESALTMNAVTGAVAAGTPVMLVGSSDAATLTIGSDYANAPQDGTALTGIFFAADVPAANNYFLGRQNGEPGFYKYGGGENLELKANRAYYAPTTSSTSFGFTLVANEDDDVTAIESALNGQSSMVNGQYFDLQGRKVQNPVKGQIYILNGKKVLF